MAIGREIAMARKRKGVTQEELTTEVPVSRESLAKYETSKRQLPQDMRKHVSEALDDPQLFFAMWKEAAGHVSIPFLNGEFVDHHPTAMRHLVQKETAEALQHLDGMSWYKPPVAWSESEREEMKTVMYEMLDAAASMMNLVAVLCDQCDMSMKDTFKYWKVSLKARRYTDG